MSATKRKAKKPPAERPKRGGKVIALARLAQLDAMGEEEVFQKYIEHGSTVAMCKDIFEPHPDYPNAARWGTDELYKWLHSVEGRWERWQVVRGLRGHIELDMVLDEALKTTPDNASAQRIIVDALKYRSGILNRGLAANLPPSAQVNVQVQIGSAWLEALREVGRQ